MKKKGFTLIELLAVIVILAVVALISVPVIINIIENAKKGALKDSAYGLIDAANMYYTNKINQMESYVLFEIDDGNQISEEKLNYKGKVDGDAMILLTKEGKVALCLTSGNVYIQKNITDKDIRFNEVEGIAVCEMPNIDDNDFSISITGSKIKDIYPIGAIYISAVEVDPGELFGGTWERFGKGETLVGVDESQTEFSTSLVEGGEKTHTLTGNEMPRHSHIFPDGTSAGAEAPLWSYAPHSASHVANVRQWYSETGTAGSNQPHNNMQPYITVYMYQRVS